MLLKHVIEALIFASQKPLTLKEIVAALRAAMDDNDEEEVIRTLAKTKEAEVAAALEELKIEYIESRRAFQLVEQASGWAIVTKPEYGIWVRQLYPESKPARLSGPALETLAIIAYRQPITRADIEAVRGVAVDGVMQSLLDRSLIRIAGRAEIPGRPLLYETTQVFMEHFGLRNLDELPNSGELRRVALPSATAEEKKSKKSKKEETEEEAAETKPPESQPEAGPSPTGVEAQALAEAEQETLAAGSTDGLAEEAPSPLGDNEPAPEIAETSEESPGQRS